MPQIVVDPLRETHRIHERDPGVGGALRALLQADDGRVAMDGRHPCADRRRHPRRYTSTGC